MGGAKLALTTAGVADEIVSVHVLVPLHVPDQPQNVAPDWGVDVNVIGTPSGSPNSQVAGVVVVSLQVWPCESSMLPGPSTYTYWATGGDWPAGKNPMKLELAAIVAENQKNAKPESVASSLPPSVTMNDPSDKTCSTYPM